MKQLVIEPKKFKTDTTTIISARVSTQLINKIDDIAKKTNRNRNEIIQMLLSFAVENSVIDNEEEIQ